MESREATSGDDQGAICWTHVPTLMLHTPTKTLGWLEPCEKKVRFAKAVEPVSINTPKYINRLERIPIALTDSEEQKERLLRAIERYPRHLDFRKLVLSIGTEIFAPSNCFTQPGGSLLVFQASDELACYISALKSNCYGLWELLWLSSDRFGEHRMSAFP